MKQAKLSAAQIRAAVAMLEGWDATKLAEAAGLSDEGARRILRGASVPQRATLEKIRTVLERQGLKFTDAGGVEPDYGFVRVLQGVDIYPALLDEITTTLRGTAEPQALFFFVDNSKSSPATVASHHRLREVAKCRYLCIENPARLDFPLADYRALPAANFHNAPQIVYGDYIAQVSINAPLRITITKGADGAQSARLIFEFLWRTLKQPIYTERHE